MFIATLCMYSSYKVYYSLFKIKAFISSLFFQCTLIKCTYVNFFFFRSIPKNETMSTAMAALLNHLSVLL